MTGQILLYAIGVDEIELIKTLAGVEQWGKPNDTVKATLVINGADAGSDEVKYIVANEDSFFYHLQTRQEVRNELASRGVYTFDDMPEFSLKPLSPAELSRLNVPQGIILLLGEGSGIPGFQAMLYQDFITGEDQFVLSFAGTGTDIWEGAWDDWVNNVEQALGRYAPQYLKAMEIGDALVNSTPGIPAGHLIATGHSLGGGLASAAAVVGGIPAHTFNAAGLHINTLYQRFPNGDLIPNGMGGYLERYVGSEARYNNAATFIRAYYVDYDILHTIQAAIQLPAIGDQEPALDGPLDLAIAVDVGIIALGAATGQSWATLAGALLSLDKMIKAHKNEAVLYGLLVKETIGAVDLFDWDVLGYDQYKKYY